MTEWQGSMVIGLLWLVIAHQNEQMGHKGWQAMFGLVGVLWLLIGMVQAAP